MKCRICNNANENKLYEVREMMIGLREKFSYFECSACGCLQIADIPKNISKYYPSNYYSFSSQRRINTIKKVIRDQRNKFAIFNKGIFGRLLYRYSPNSKYRMLSHIPLTKDSAILDVGCGVGEYLYDLKELGFKNLLGIDPFIKEDIEYANGLKIVKGSIYETFGKWDLIMFHHSFEHISDPVETLTMVSELLSENGYCLIRIPTVSSYAWDHYRENWVQIDAPRHFFLHSVKSINFIANKVGLRLKRIIYDSRDFQFWGSEQYIKDIPLRDKCSYAIEPTKSIFSIPEIKDFKQRAIDLNKRQQGDSCAFFLTKN